MTEERDLRGFTIPFAAGVAMAVLCIRGQIYADSIFASASYTLCLTATIAIITYTRKSGNCTHAGWITILLTAFAGLSAGLCIGFGNAVLGISSIPWVLEKVASDAGERLTEAVDRICFSDPETNALVKALLTGDRSGLSNRTKEIFTLSGASHILALSGLHLGIIYGMVHKILAPAAKVPQVSAAISVIMILVCGAYTMITGAGPSITRAFIFITIREIAKICGRDMDLKKTLTASLMIHLATSPHSITSVGFQLSYSAIFGIAYLFPPIKNIWPSDNETSEKHFPILRKIWEISALSLSCQITAGSLAWLYFGNFPEYFIITNLIAMPLSAILIPLSVITLLFESLGWRIPIIIEAAEFTAKIMTGALETISNL